MRGMHQVIDASFEVMKVQSVDYFMKKREQHSLQLVATTFLCFQAVQLVVVDGDWDWLLLVGRRLGVC